MRWNDENIVFIISLPRSGSTLLQRILATHPEVASTSESWLLLPQLYALREYGAFSVYGHAAASYAANDFCKCLTGGRQDYLAVIKAALLENFYNVSGNNKNIYIEKTPRNTLVLREIVSMFPGSKYIFLWRNPAAIVASMMTSFSAGKWNLYRQEIDLYEGLQNMLGADGLNSAYRFDIRYEDLVAEPQQKTEEIFKFLGLDFQYSVDQFLDTRFQGRMGDPTGVKKYSAISSQSLDTWRSSFSNPLRKRWITRYIEEIGEDGLRTMGYDMYEILDSIKDSRTGFDNFFSDSARMLYGALDRRFQLSLIRRVHKESAGKRKYTLQ